MIKVFIGIDIHMGVHPVSFVALDSAQKLMALGEGEVADALAFAAGQMNGALVAVNAAARPNRGRMTRAGVRQELNPPPAKGKYTSLRQAEYELLQAGMKIPETPASAEKSLPWVQRGFTLVEKLTSFGYVPWQTENEPGSPIRQWLETNADAAFWSLLGVVPLHSGTLEGRIQRQLALADEELDVPDAMDFFEELTRFKLLKSSLPDKNIFSQPEINAWMAAHTAWLAVHDSKRIRCFGEPEEGIITLPGRSL